MDLAEQIEEMRIGLHRKTDFQLAALDRLESERMQRQGDVMASIDAVSAAIERGEAHMRAALYRLRDVIAPLPEPVQLGQSDPASLSWEAQLNRVFADRDRANQFAE